MKKIGTIIYLLIVVFALRAQVQTCCSSHSEFANLSTDNDFVLTHAEPLPLPAFEEKGKMITFSTPDGKTAMAYEVKANEKSNKTLLVFHEWWGLNDYIKKMADQLAGDFPNTNIIAADLYDGKVANTREEAQELMQGLQTERGVAIINGMLTYAGKQAEIATIGWCMGGGWSLQTALLAKENAVACVMYYGMPEGDLNKLKNLNADVLFVWAEQDKWINEEVVDQFQENMNIAGKKLIIKPYDADHAFANPSNPDYNAAASKDAYAQTLTFLKTKLK